MREAGFQTSEQRGAMEANEGGERMGICLDFQAGMPFPSSPASCATPPRTPSRCASWDGARGRLGRAHHYRSRTVPLVLGIELVPGFAGMRKLADSHVFLAILQATLVGFVRWWWCGAGRALGVWVMEYIARCLGRDFWRLYGVEVVLDALCVMFAAVLM